MITEICGIGYCPEEDENGFPIYSCDDCPYFITVDSDDMDLV